MTGWRFNCAAPFRERLGVPARRGRAGLHLPRFNCAAPFRERLAGAAGAEQESIMQLQLCRPLSGAVRGKTPTARLHPRLRFNCAAPFRERLGRHWRGRGYTDPSRFNCAAPFRERLAYTWTGTTTDTW